MSKLFDEIQRFRAEELPSFYERLAMALNSGTEQYEAELESYTTWAVKRTCELVFPDFLGARHRPEDFFLAFSIGSSLLNGEGRHICFSDKVIEPDLRNVFCPYCAAELDHDCCDNDERTPSAALLATHAKQFLTTQLPDAWFGLIAKALPQRVDFSVDAPQVKCAFDRAARRELFTVLWRTKALISETLAEDLLLLDDGAHFRSCESIIGHINGVLNSFGGSLGHEPTLQSAGSFVSAAYQAFIDSAICALDVNRQALRRNGYVLSRFLDICMNWLLLGLDFSMTVCYGGAHSPQARRCNGMLFLYTKEELGPLRRFALAEMAHFVLDNLVSLEDEHHAIQQGQLEGEREGMERLRSALSYLSHDYTNSRDMLRNVKSVEQAARIFETLLWLLKAARKYAIKSDYNVESAYVDWTLGGYRGTESVGQTLQLAYDHCNDNQVALSVHGDALAGVLLDVRFVGVLTELARNIAKHTRRNGIGAITIRSEGGDGTVVIEAHSGPTYNDPCRGVRKVLSLEDDYTLNRQWKGVLTIKRFCLDLLTDDDRPARPEQWWRSDVAADGTPMIRFTSPSLSCARIVGREEHPL